MTRPTVHRDRDPLELLATMRREQRRGGSYRFGYLATRRDAMRPVDLPGQRHSAWLRSTIDPILARYVEGAR